MNKIERLLKETTITKRSKDGKIEMTKSDRLKLEEFLHASSFSTLLYRYVGDKYLRSIYNSDTTNIDVLSKHIFLYGDKGDLFYENIKGNNDKRDFSDIEKDTFKYIYAKLYKVFVNTDNLKSFKTKDALLYLSSIHDLKNYFDNTSLENWIDVIEKLSEYDKTIIKNYYMSFLHTVGKAGVDNNSYHLSTSTKYDFCCNWSFEHKEKYNEDGIILIGWPGKQKCIKTFGKRNCNHIKKLGFPVIEEALFPEQHEITLMCGLLPHNIIGFFYDDKFEVNPYIFKVEDMETVINDGLPIEQKDFLKNLSDTNIKSFYSMCDGFYW